LDKESVWTCMRAAAAAELAEPNVKVWLNPLQPLRIEAQTLYLGCPNRFFMAWVREHYYPHLVAALDAARAEGYKVEEVKLEVAAAPGPPQKEGYRPQPDELPHLEIHRRAPLRFNRRFTFDRFVVGSANQYAFSASLALAEGENLHTDALYLLAGPGLGKSHLSQAIGQHILCRQPDRRVFYLTAEDFTNELIYSLKNQNTAEFKDKYRRHCDVLVLEEVNFLSGKEKIQAELSFTLDCLNDNGKKIVFTSSSLPKDIPRLGCQFASRLSNSLISTIRPPDYETRLSILRQKARENGLVIPKPVLEFMAARLIKDVRRMESCLLGLGAKSKLLARPIDLALAEEALRDLVEEEAPGGFNPELIQNTVCHYYQVSLDDLRSRSRRKNVVLTRNVGMYLCRQLTDLSLEAIGKAFSRNHSTVLYSVNLIENRTRRDSKLRGQLDFLTDQIKHRLSI